MPYPEPRPKYRPLNCAEDDKKFPCVDVWGPDGTSKRFALGTRASFVVDRFNKKHVDALKPVVFVEAFKHGEESVEFGPDAPLMAMCEWDLRVVQEAPFEPIPVGAKIPNGELSYLDDDGKLQCYGIHDLVSEKRVVFFGIPGTSYRLAGVPILSIFVHQGHFWGWTAVFFGEIFKRTSTDLHVLRPVCEWHFAKPLGMTMFRDAIVTW